MVYATKVCRSAQRKLFAQYQQKPFQRAFIDEPATTAAKAICSDVRILTVQTGFSPLLNASFKTCKLTGGYISQVVFREFPFDCDLF